MEKNFHNKIKTDEAASEGPISHLHAGLIFIYVHLQLDFNCEWVCRQVVLKQGGGQKGNCYKNVRTWNYWAN